MTSAGASGSRKRPAECGEDDHQPLKRTRTFSSTAANFALGVTSGFIQGASYITGKMAEWVLTPRTDYRDIYNVKRRNEPRRTLAQGELTNRLGIGGIRGRMENSEYQDGESYITDRPFANSNSSMSNKSKYTNPSFRFGCSQGNINLAGYHAKTEGQSTIRARQSILPTEKYGKRRSGENFRDYTNFGNRLFGKSPRKMRQYGSTVDRVRNIEERNNYAALLASMTNVNIVRPTPAPNKYSNFRFPRNNNRDDDVIVTGVDKPTNQRARYGAQTSFWESVDDSSCYIRTERDNLGGVKPHSLRPWNNHYNGNRNRAKTIRTARARAPRDRVERPGSGVPTGRGASSEANERYDTDVDVDLSMTDRTGSDRDRTGSDRDRTGTDHSLGLSSFVRHMREGLQTKRNVEDVFCLEDDVIEERPRTSPSVRKVTSPRYVTSHEVIDLEKPNEEEDEDLVLLGEREPEVVVELEVLTPNRCQNNRVESPDVITIEPPPMTSSRSRDVFEERLKAIPYCDRSWIKLQREESEERQRSFLRSRVAAETEIRIFDESRKKQSDRLEEAIRKQLRIAELVPAVIEEPEDDEEEEGIYPELTPEMEKTVDSALYGGPPSQVLVDHMRIQIRRSDVQTLEGTTWLNDEVINFHMNLMTQRGEEKGRPKVHAFNTFFYQKLVQDGHSSLKRWTRKIDVFSKDYLVVPVHLQMHWCMAIVDFRKKEIRYYDSMGGRNNTCLKAVKKYLEEESIDKKKQPYDTSAWQLINAKGPQQMNGSDCGVFSTICAEHVTRDAPLTYTQDLMPYFRRRMVYEIMSKKLLQ